MNKKMIYRILGALASALIIIAVFVPFISVAGYSLSLWSTYNSNAIYLPIMIIIFGAIGVIFFSLNIKTEFAYMSTGAIIFFEVMNTIDVINNGNFGSFGIGYYFLIIGAILTGVMTFLLNMRSNQVSEKIDTVSNLNQENILNKIDKLYDDQVPSEITPMQPVTPLNQSDVLPIQPIQSSTEPPIQPINNIPVQPIQSSVEPPIQPIDNISMQPIEEPPMSNIPIQSSIPDVVNDNKVGESQSMVNPVVQDFQFNIPITTQSQVDSPVSELNNMPSMTNNPVTDGFINSPTIQQPTSFESEINPIPNSSVQQNPVVQEFTSNATTPIYNQNNNTGQTDIFGQPIKK